MSLAVLAAGALFTLPPAGLDAGRIELGIAATAGATIRHGLGRFTSDPESAVGIAYGGALTAGVRVVGGLRLGVIGANEAFAHSSWEPPAIWMVGGWIGGRWGRSTSIGFMFAAGAAYGYERQGLLDGGTPTSRGSFVELRLGPSFRISETSEFFIDFSVLSSRSLRGDDGPTREWGSFGTMVIVPLGPANLGLRFYL